MAKLKGWMDVRMTLQHNTRERMPPNADPKWSGGNYNFGGDVENTMQRMDTLMPEKVRENAVRAVEVVMTASPDFSGNWKDYLKACDEWAQGIFGKSNLMHINHHYDETTPHTHIVFTPIKDGKLNASYFIGGHRNRMVELQNDFYQKVGKGFSLERGQSKAETKARHAHHTLAGKTAELDERERTLAEKNTKLDEREHTLAEKNTKLDEREKKLKQTAAELDRIQYLKPFLKDIEEGVMRNTKFKTPEQKKRVFDYTMKTMPKHISSCSMAVSRDEDLTVQKPNQPKRIIHR